MPKEIHVFGEVHDDEESKAFKQKLQEAAKRDEIIVLRESDNWPKIHNNEIGIEHPLAIHLSRLTLGYLKNIPLGEEAGTEHSRKLYITLMNECIARAYAQGNCWYYELSQKPCENSEEIEAILNINPQAYVIFEDKLFFIQRRHEKLQKVSFFEEEVPFKSSFTIAHLKQHLNLKKTEAPLQSPTPISLTTAEVPLGNSGPKCIGIISSEKFDELTAYDPPLPLWNAYKNAMNALHKSKSEEDKQSGQIVKNFIAKMLEIYKGGNFLNIADYWCDLDDYPSELKNWFFDNKSLWDNIARCLIFFVLEEIRKANLPFIDASDEILTEEFFDNYFDKIPSSSEDAKDIQRTLLEKIAIGFRDRAYAHNLQQLANDNEITGGKAVYFSVGDKHIKGLRTLLLPDSLPCKIKFYDMPTKPPFPDSSTHSAMHSGLNSNLTPQNTLKSTSTTVVSLSHQPNAIFTHPKPRLIRKLEPIISTSHTGEPSNSTAVPVTELMKGATPDKQSLLPKGRHNSNSDDESPTECYTNGI